jgi:glycerol-3-phosphate dehydrogenase (NAD(P)+)
MVVEGVNTCKAAYRLSKKHNIVMPVTEQLYYVLFEGKDPREAVEELMLRDRNHELGIVSDDYDLFQ